MRAHGKKVCLYGNIKTRYSLTFERTRIEVLKALQLHHTDLKKVLRAIFVQFGTLLDIYVSKSYKLRGQAGFSSCRLI